MRILDRQGSTFGCLCGVESPLNRPKHTVILSGKIVFGWFGCVILALNFHGPISTVRFSSASFIFLNMTGFFGCGPSETINEAIAEKGNTVHQKHFNNTLETP